ncbi:MAG: hypothetical protein QXP70_03130 [Methanomassiliicoccales archaeon]
MDPVSLDPYFPPAAFRIYLVILIAGAVGGILYDAIWKKKIVTYAREIEWKRSFGKGDASNRSRFSVAISVLFRNIFSSGEIASCEERSVDVPRRVAHLLLFWGLIVSALSMLVRAFIFPTLNDFPFTNGLVISTVVGYVMLLAGGLTMLFFRVNVRSELQPVLSSSRADLFLYSVIAATLVQFLLLGAQFSGNSAFAIGALVVYVPVTAIPFLTMAWSKFPHIIYKPFYAFRRELDMAEGYSHLPSPSKTNFIKTK